MYEVITKKGTLKRVSTRETLVEAYKLARWFSFNEGTRSYVVTKAGTRYLVGIWRKSQSPCKSMAKNQRSF